MKNTIILFSLIFITSIGCSDEMSDSQQETSIIGTWSLHVIEHESNMWLRDLSFSTWQPLQLTFESNEENVINLTSSNSPDHNIFPKSANWSLETIREDFQKFTGSTDGSNLDGSTTRTYMLFQKEDKLIITTLVEPDCPKDVDCTLDICCDVYFEFIRNTATNE